MHKSQLVIDTKVKPVLGPHSANLVVGTGVSGKGQRTRSNSDASASSSLSTSTSASMTSLAVPKSLHLPSPQSRSQSPSSPQDETVRVSSEYVLAMHDYDHKSNTTCLSFRAGQVIHVLNRDPSGWWDGELEGRRGWFPSNYVNTDYGRSAAQVARRPQRVQHRRESSTTSTSSWSTTSLRRQPSHQSPAGGFSAEPIQYSNPIMVPMVHGLSLLQNAVRSNRVTHFQPSAACIIACVRRILTTTETINRDAPVLRRFPVLAQERSKVLTALAKLVSQARRASDETLLEEDLANEIAEMLKTGGLLFSHVRRFLVVAVQCGIELPQEPEGGHGSSPTENGAWRGGESETTDSPDNNTPTQQRQWERSNAPDISPTTMRAKSMVNLRKGPPTQRAVPISRTASAQAQPMPGRTLTRHRVALSTSSTSSSSSFSSQEVSVTPSPPPFPSGPTTSTQVLDVLRYTHDQYLSTIAAFIGHAHSYSRSSHASNTGHLYELTRAIVGMVEKILTIVVAVMAHPDVPTKKVNHLRSANEGLYTVASVLTESIRRLTIPLAATMSEEEEKVALIRSATGALRAGADCVAAVKVCLNRAGGERQFIIHLPYADGQEPRHQPQRQAHSPKGILTKSTSMGILHQSSQVVEGDDEDVTIHPGSSNVVGRPREVSPSLENGGISKVSTDATVISSGKHRPPPLSLSREPVEPDLASPVSFTRTDDDGTTWEGSARGHGIVDVGPLEEKMVNGELSTVGFDQAPVNWLYTHDYSLEDVAYNSEGHLVGATLEVLVEKMTPHDTPVDSAFSSVFFMTFRLFTSPGELVDAIIARYNLVPPRNTSLSVEELHLWQHKKGLPVRLRVTNLIKTWVESFWRSGVDDQVIPTLMTFTKEALREFFPGPAQKLLDLLETRRRVSEAGGGDNKGRDPFVKPLVTGDVPRPNMTKTLLVALRKKDYVNISPTDFDALELARQITIMECTLYCAIQPEEILDVGQDSTKARTVVSVKAVTSLSTVITGWVAESILNEQDMKKRMLLIKFFIKVADRCTALNNYSTSRSILAALDSSTIARLHQTWAGVPQKSKIQLEALRRLADHGRNYYEYRSRLRNTTPPAVPFLGLYLTDVTFCREGNPSHRASPLNNSKKLLNFNKYHKLARIVQDMQRFQVPYNLKAIPEVQNYLNMAFENAKHRGDFQDLYRRSLLVEPKQPADTAPTSDMRQLFNWATRSLPTTAPS